MALPRALASAAAAMSAAVVAFPKCFYAKVLYVMGKDLTVELSCPLTGLVESLGKNPTAASLG